MVVWCYHFVSRLSDGDEKSSKKRIVAVACMTANGRRFSVCLLYGVTILVWYHNFFCRIVIHQATTIPLLN